MQPNRYIDKCLAAAAAAAAADDDADDADADSDADEQIYQCGGTFKRMRRHAI